MSVPIFLVANSKQEPNILKDIACGLSHRIDYMVLADYLKSDYIDRQSVPSALERFDTHRLRAGLAMYSLRRILEDRPKHIFWWAESIAIPGTLMLPWIPSSLILHHPMSKSKLPIIRLLGKRWKHIIVWTEYERELLITQLGLPPDKVIATLAPIDTSFYCPEPGHEEQDEGYVLAAGVSHRNYDVLLRAMKLLPDIPCVINVSTVSDIIPVERKEELPPNVRLDFSDTPVGVRDLFRKCSLGVVPMQESTQYSAGCTTVGLFELMAKPVLLSGNKHGIGEYMQEDAGYILPSNDAEALAKKIDLLWRYPKTRKFMGKSGRHFALARMDLDKWVEKIGSLLVNP